MAETRGGQQKSRPERGLSGQMRQTQDLAVPFLIVRKEICWPSVYTGSETFWKSFIKTHSLWISKFRLQILSPAILFTKLRRFVRRTNDACNFIFLFINSTCSNQDDPCEGGAK